MRTTAKLALATLGLSVMSCSSGAAPPESFEQREQPIYYGQVDTTHDAVVAIFLGNGWCSGTIVDVQGSSGYVLTAAHCVTNPGPTAKSPSQIQIYQGDNRSSPDHVYSVVQVAFHPLYDGDDGSANDFGMVRFTGASASTPRIPAMTPAQDNLTVGTQVDLVGYGVTDTQDNNSLRRHILKPISELTGGWLVFDQSGISGGTCSGDSGGPALTLGTERVAGVTSFGDSQTCMSASYSGRVSEVYDSFIQPFISGTTGVISCQECNNGATAGNGACVSTIEACFNNTGCSTFATCLNGCSDAACQQQCISSNPTGSDMYFGILECICNTCDSECANDPMCQVSGCGFAFNDATCNTCNEASCCAEATACAADATCSSCVTSASPPASCSTNPISNTWNACLAQNCGTECGTGGGASCGFTSADADCQTCFESNCCAEATACANNQTCVDCLSVTPTPAGCNTNALLDGFVGCLNDSCGTECGSTAGTGGSGGFTSTGGTGGVGGMSGAGGTAGSAGMGGTGTAGIGGSSAGSGGATAGTGGSTAGTGGTAATPSDSSGDSGGCSTSGGQKSNAGAWLLLGAALAFIRRRK